MKNFCAILFLLMTNFSSAHAGVVDKVLGKVLPPAPYTTQAAVAIAHAQQRLERPVVGAGMSDKQRVEVVLSYVRATYTNAGYSLDASIAKLVKDVAITGGFQPLAIQVTEAQPGRGDWGDTALFLTSTYATNLAGMANDSKFTPYFPQKLLADLRALSTPTPKAKISAPEPDINAEAGDLKNGTFAGWIMAGTSYSAIAVPSSDGDESSNIALYFANQSAIGKKILAACKDTSTCKITGTYRLNGIPKGADVIGARNHGEWASVKSAQVVVEN